LYYLKYDQLGIIVVLGPYYRKSIESQAVSACRVSRTSGGRKPFTFFIGISVSALSMNTA